MSRWKSEAYGVVVLLDHAADNIVDAAAKSCILAASFEIPHDEAFQRAEHSRELQCVEHALYLVERLVNIFDEKNLSGLKNVVGSAYK